MREPSTQLTPQQVARYCGVTAQTVFGWLANGRLAASNADGQKWVNASELIDFMDENHLAIPADLINPPSPALTKVLNSGLPYALVVDNDTATSRAIVDILKELGLSSIRVANAKDAQADYDQFHPQLITLELEAGDTSCLALIESVRLHHPTETKVLVVSNQMPSTLIKAKSAGADAIVTKPFDNDTLKRTVRILLNLGGL